jgi:hypothetical protein
MNKYISIKNISLFVMIAIFGIPSFSFAQLGVNLESTTNVTGNLETEIQNTLEANTGLEVESNIGVNTALEVNEGVDLNANLESNINVELKNETNIDSNTESRSNMSLELNTAGIAVLNSNQVKSDADLKVFTKNYAAKNKNVVRVDVLSENDVEVEAKTKVSVTYNHAAKLFGFISTNIKSTTTIEAKADGTTNVDVSTSWWSFLATEKTISQSELQANFENNTNIKANVSAKASAKAKAQAIEQITAEIEAHASVKATGYNSTRKNNNSNN